MTPLDGGDEQMLALPYHPANSSSRSPSPNYRGGGGGGGGRDFVGSRGGAGGHGYENNRQPGVSRSSSRSRMGGGGGANGGMRNGGTVHSRQSRSSSPQGMLALEYGGQHGGMMGGTPSHDHGHSPSPSPPREMHMDYNEVTPKTGLEARFGYGGAGGVDPTASVAANHAPPPLGTTTATGARFPPELQCKNFLRGHCKRGDRCPLKHANKCYDNHRGGCSDPSCPFVHVALCTNARCDGPSNCVYDHVNT